MSLDAIKLKLSGDCLCKLSESYLVQNDNPCTIEFKIDSSQVRLQEWEDATTINNSIINGGRMNRVIENLEGSNAL